MSHIGFRYTYMYCVLCADVLSSVFITCDFCVLNFELHVLSFPFVVCVICFEDCDFLSRRHDADAEMEKERVQRDKNGNINNVAFYAVSSSSPYGYLCPKLKTQKSKHRSHHFRKKNTKHLYSKQNATNRLP